MMTRVDTMKSYVDAAVDYSKGKADTLIARMTRTSGSQIRFSQSMIDISNRWEDLSLDLFAVVEGSKTCSSERSVNSLQEVRQAVDDTISLAKRLPKSMLYNGVEESVHRYDELKGQFDDRLDDYAEKAPGVINAAIDAAMREGAKRCAGALKFAKRTVFLRSSQGPEGSARSTTFDFNIRAFQDELDYSGQGLHCGVRLSEAEKQLVEAGAQAGRLSKQAAGANQGEPGIYDLVLSPTVAANVLGFLPESANPFAVMIGMSPLGDKMGQPLAPELVTVHDDPRFPGGLNSRPFDVEGTPTQRTTIFDRGVLKSFLHNTTTAKLYETKSTGSSELVSLGEGLKMLLPASTNTVFDNGTTSLTEMLEGNRPTIHVTCNWYTRWQNYQTGEFSTIPRDAMFLIKGGRSKPIKNLRISDNILHMFASIMALGNDRKQVYWWEVDVPTFIPSVRIADCRMTAATQ